MKKSLIGLIVLILMVVNIQVVNAFDSVEASTTICGDLECTHLINSQNESYLFPSNKDAYFTSQFFEDSSFDGIDIASATIAIDVPSGLTIENVNYDSATDGYDITRTDNTFTYVTKGESVFSEVGTIRYSVRIPQNTGSLTEYAFTTTITVYDASGNVLKTDVQTIKLYTATTLTQNTYDDNINLSNITISSGTMSPAFEKNTYTYTINADSENLKIDIGLESAKSTLLYYGYQNGETQIDLFAEGNPDAASRTFTIPYGTTTIYYSVNSELYGKSIAEICGLPENVTSCMDEACNMCDFSGSQHGSYELISFNVVRNDNRSTVNTLNTLTLSEGEIKFNPDLRIYSVSVPNKTDSITINSTLSDAKSSYVEGFGNRKVVLEEGPNTILVKVKSEKGQEGIYTIIVTRELSDDTSIKEILVNKKLIKVNDKDLKYAVNVNNDVTKAEIEVTPNNAKAKVEVGKIETLKEGDNLVKITVTAPNGDKKVYELNIKRDTSISSNSNLSELKIEGYDIDFAPNVKSYTIKIKDEAELKISVKCEHEKAKFIVVGNKNLQNGSVIKVKVTAEDRSESTYELTIEKEVKKEEESNVVPLIVCGVVILGSIIGICIAVKVSKKKKVYSLKDAEVNQEIEVVPEKETSQEIESKEETEENKEILNEQSENNVENKVENQTDSDVIEKID